MCDGDKQCTACAQRTGSNQETADSGNGLNLFDYIFGPVKTDSEVTISDQLIVKVMIMALVVILGYFTIKALASKL